MNTCETKHCGECRAEVRNAAGGFCPLCGALLHEGGFGGAPPAANLYPDLRRRTAQSGFVLRLFLFLSLWGGACSLLVNWLVPVGIWWSLIVVLAMAYLWASIPPLLRGGVNYTKRILFQVLFTCLLAAALDALTGRRGWSVSYAIPGLLCAGIVGIGAMAAFSGASRRQHILYQMLMALLGFAPLLLWALGLARNLVMVLVTLALALASLLSTVIFGPRTVKDEFTRRFHF